jgi:3-hydroxyisobutyrate dehydrogenase-like beta-hydroxyacid dehydrogenase
MTTLVDTPDAQRVGFVGLGIMGSAMAHHLLERGWTVFGHDIDPARVQAFAAAGGMAVASPAEVAHNADEVLTILPGGDILREVVAGSAGLLTAANPRLLVADCGTFDIADKADCCARLELAGARMLDCTISGTGAQARTRDLVIYTSGDAGDHARLVPAFEDCARAVHHTGAFGNASKVKYIANLLVAVHTVAAAEAMVLAERAGLDLAAVFELVRSGAGGSRMFELRAPQMVEGRYDRDVASKLDIWQKDMQVIGRFAKSLECAVPLFSASAQVFTAAMAQGFDKEDMAAVCRVLERLNGIDRAP